jgi:hypothetical protein
MTPSDAFKSKSATKLKALARDEFGEPSEAESRMLDAAATRGMAFCGEYSDLDHPSNAPAFSETGSPAAPLEPWGKDREIRAEVIRWLCAAEDAKKLLDPSGIHVIGARIVKPLNMTSLHIPVPIAFRHCRILEPATFEACELESVDMEGTWTRDLNFSFATVKHSLMLYRNFRADGQLDLRRIHIAQDLRLESALLLNPSGFALRGDGSNIGGYAFLRVETFAPKKPTTTFGAVGTVSFLNAIINADLDCGGAQFHNPGKTALELGRSVIGGLLRLSSGSGFEFHSEGMVDLRLCHCRSFEDDMDHWPPGNQLRLDGFVYDSASGNGWDAATRQIWLNLDRSPATQPYRQLAKVLSDSGDEEGARQVLIAMEDKLALREPLVKRVPKRVFQGFIGYGYRPGRAAWGLAGVTTLGAILYWHFDRKQKIIPTDKDAAAAFKTKEPLPDHYPKFQPVIFSLENTFPLVKLGQVDKWQTLQKSRLRWIVWIQVLLGWLLATLFLAGVSGLVQQR